MSEYTVVGMKTADITAADWTAAEAAIDSLNATSTRVWNGTTYSAFSSVGEWRLVLNDECTDRPDNDPRTRSLLELLPEDGDGPLTGEQIEAVRDLLKADLARVREIACGEPDGEIYEGYECYGELEAIGDARILRMRLDLRVFSNAVDGPYYSLRRLVDMDILSAIPGVEQIDE